MAGQRTHLHGERFYSVLSRDSGLLDWAGGARPGTWVKLLLCTQRTGWKRV
jgi:hypothetical protein